MLQEIVHIFQENSDTDIQKGMTAYMKNNFQFFGIKSPLRKEISKQIFKDSKSLEKTELMVLVSDLWKQPQRELHYLAMEMAFRNLKKKWTLSDIDFLEELALNNSWWDSIDFIAPKLMADYFLMFPEQIEKHTQKWLNSGNIWLVRCAILFQLKYKDKTDLELLYKIILEACHTNEFFINKAIGWVLRENSKRIPNEIKSFIEFHTDKLSNLSKKEGLRLIV